MTNTCVVFEYITKHLLIVVSNFKLSYSILTMLKRSLNLLYVRKFIKLQTSLVSTTSFNNNVAESLHKNKYTKEKLNKLSEEQENKMYFVKDDPNVFGNLNTPTKELINENHLNDTGDIKEETLIQNPVSESKRLSTKQYADIIKAYLHKRQIKEAIDLLEIRMIKEDRVKPENYIYNLILGGCGRVGYTKKAFKLFNDMKKRGLYPTNGTYTALFNACANSPWLEDGLTRATQLRELMKEKGVIPNDTNYNSMIKAFGRCGDLKTAFSLVDEMIENNILIKEDTINFLLHSCITDKDAGFRHALLVWRKYHQKNIKPDIYSFNLMLRCVRDCSLGDVETMKNLLESPEFKMINNTSNLLLHEPKNILPTVQNQSEETSSEIQCNWPNLMAPIPYLGNIIKLNEITKPEDRLMLVGGSSGFLENMKHFKVKPDIKTFTQLLDCIPSTLAAEKALLSAIKKDGVKFDVDFLNMLIKKRSMRFDYENARDVVITLFKPPKLRPDLITYGVLALGCDTKEHADNLIQEMTNSGYRINIVILGAMLKQACIKMNYVYVLELMDLAVKEQVKPNKMFVQHLEDLYKRSKNESKERKGKFFVKGFHLFRMRYKKWLEEVKIDSSEDVHPWEQFRKPTESNVKNYKDPGVHFKPRVTSRFRQKTGINK